MLGAAQWTSSAYRLESTIASEDVNGTELRPVQRRPDPRSAGVLPDIPVVVHLVDVSTARNDLLGKGVIVYQLPRTPLPFQNGVQRIRPNLVEGILAYGDLPCCGCPVDLSPEPEASVPFPQIPIAVLLKQPVDSSGNPSRGWIVIGRRPSAAQEERIERIGFQLLDHPVASNLEQMRLSRRHPLPSVEIAINHGPVHRHAIPPKNAPIGVANERGRRCGRYLPGGNIVVDDVSGLVTKAVVHKHLGWRRAK